VEKGFTRTAIGRELVDPKAKVKNLKKVRDVIILEIGKGEIFLDIEICLKDFSFFQFPNDDLQSLPHSCRKGSSLISLHLVYPDVRGKAVTLNNSETMTVVPRRVFFSS